MQFVDFPYAANVFVLSVNQERMKLISFVEQKTGAYELK